MKEKIFINYYIFKYILMTDYYLKLVRQQQQIIQTFTEIIRHTLRTGTFG